MKCDIARPCRLPLDMFQYIKKQVLLLLPQGGNEAVPNDPCNLTQVQIGKSGQKPHFTLRGLYVCTRACAQFFQLSLNDPAALLSARFGMLNTFILESIGALTLSVVFAVSIQMACRALRFT